MDETERLAKEKAEAQLATIQVRALSHNLSLIKQGNLPKSYPNISLDSYIQYPDGRIIPMRDYYIKECGFPLLAEDWIKPLAKWIGRRKCLEVMAGCGSITYFLKKYKVRIRATDNFSWSQKFQHLYTNIESIDAVEAVTKYGRMIDFIVCSWPYMDDTAYRVLLEMRRVNPKCRMIYIGENWGGCTADDAFFEAIEYCEVKGFIEAVKHFRHWNGIYDSILLLK